MAVVHVQRVRLEVEVGAQDVEVAVPVDVFDEEAHGARRFAVQRHGEAARQRLVRERAVALVHEQVGRLQIVGDEHVRPAVVVHVAEDDRVRAQRPVELQSGRARRLAEAAGPVAEEVAVGCARVEPAPVLALRPPADLHAVDHVAPPAVRRVLGVEQAVVGDIQVEVPVPIRVAEGSARTPELVPEPRLCRRFVEMPVLI